MNLMQIQLNGFRAGALSIASDILKRHQDSPRFRESQEAMMALQMARREIDDMVLSIIREGQGWRPVPGDMNFTQAQVWAEGQYPGCPVEHHSDGRTYVLVPPDNTMSPQ